ncbi:hypothetical protein HDU67_006418 [Dinochytrium kinnereticum]|nr:hypothetical protein HDU67_006418 [Dinochytrium kinnereticum]
MAVERFSRRPEVTDQYIKWRADMPKIYASVPDFIKIEVLAFPYDIDGYGKKVARGDIQQPGLKNKVLRLNDFPYATKPEENIQHLVLWYLGEDELSRDEVVAILQEKMPGFEYLYFVNPPNRKTIPEYIGNI